MRQIGVIMLSVLFLVALTELTYWSIFDFVIYNDSALNNGLTLWYYHSAGLIALLLSFLLFIYFNHISPLLRNLVILIINTYSLFSINQLIFTNCDEIKNLPLFYCILSIMTLLCIGYFFISRIINKMNRIDMIIVSISTILLLVDFLFFWVGFEVFYL